MQEEGRLIEQVFGRLGVLRDDALREPLEPALLLGGEIARRAHDQRAFAERTLAAQLLDELDSVHVGQPEVDDGAVEALFRERGECLARGGDRRRVDVSVPDQLDDPIALDLVALDEEEVLHGPADAVLQPRERRLDRRRGERFHREAESGARGPRLDLPLDRDHVDRDVTRSEVELQLALDPPPAYVRVAYVAGYSIRLV